MDAALWFRDWAIQYNGFPDNYLVIDTETTGKDISKDIIIQCGWCKVVNRKVVDNGGILLDWSRSPYVDPSWIRRRMVLTSTEMAKKHKVYPWKFDMLAGATNPIHGLADLLDKICEIRSENGIIVAHNGIGLDYPMIAAHFKRFLKIKFEFRPEEMWDTGALEKGSQINEFMYECELPGDFAWRVLERNTDCGIKWSLHSHVIHKYDLANKYNLNLDEAHNAIFDSYVTHLLFEEFRTLAEIGLERYPYDPYSDPNSCRY